MISQIPFVDVPGVIPEDEEWHAVPIDAIINSIGHDLYGYGTHRNNAPPTKPQLRELETQLEATVNLLEYYGARKQRAYNNVVAGFVKTFRRLQNVDLNPEPDWPDDKQAPHEASDSMKSARVIPFRLHDWAETQVNRFKAIEKTTRFANATLSKVCASLRKTVSELETIIKREGEDFSHYSAGNRRVVFRSIQLAQLLKTLFATPILDEEDNLVLSSRKRIEAIAAVLDSEKAALASRMDDAVIAVNPT